MLINVRALSKAYQTRSGVQIQALSDIDLAVEQGEFICVVGPSGCGKSTLLKVLAGLLDFSSGQALLNGRPITGPRRDVGVVFQEARLLPWMTVMDNVLVPARVQKLPPEASRQRATAFLALAGLADFAARYPSELSGGMQQRVAICRALVHDPAILLMDEPFGALDAMTREAMNLELLRIWSASEKTVLFITHSIPEAVFLADRVIVMTPRPGRIQRRIEIDLPRPRTLQTMASPHFAALTGELRAVFDARGAFH